MNSFRFMPAIVVALTALALNMPTNTFPAQTVMQPANPPKFALVIGNADYIAGGRLLNPVNDATDMRAALESLGFQVNLVADGNLEAMEEGMIWLRNRLLTSRESYGLFYYAGHGVQSGGENYLLPVDADIRSESLLRARALPAQVVLDEMQTAGNSLNVVILDACRNNPFSWARSGPRGLTVMGHQPPGSIIVYATSAGRIAEDGLGRNGTFTAELLKHLREPGLEVSELFRRVGRDVTQASGGTQTPAVYSQFFDTAYLGSVPTASPTFHASVPQPQPVDVAASARPAVFADAPVAGKELPLPAAPARPLSEETACGTVEVNFSARTDNKQRPMPGPEPGQAMVYVLQPFRSGVFQHKLAMDGRWIGANRGGTYFYFTAAPGYRQFCSQFHGNRSIFELTLEPDKTYFLQQVLTLTMGRKSTSHLVVLTDVEGREMLKKLNLSVFTEKR